MRKIIVLSYLTFDGFTASKDGSSKWIVWDKGVDAYYVETQREADALFLGRTTYEGLKDYWSTSKSAGENPEMIEFSNKAKKYVFSKSLENAGWNNSEILRSIVPEEIEAIKNEPGKNIVVIGSGSIVSQLQNAGLVDEYRFISMPVILGEGKPYFTNLDDTLDLELVETKSFNCGSVLHRYQIKIVDSNEARDQTAKSKQ